MAIKLIAIDIDGTLINSNYKISSYTKEIIGQARAKGIRIVLCTGRPLLGAQRYVEELGLHTANEYVITYNGALIHQTLTKQSIFHLGVTGKDYKKIAQLAIELNTHFHAVDEQAIYTSNRNISRYTGHDSYFSTMPILYRTVEEIDDDTAFTKLMFIDEPAVLDAAIANIPAAIHEQYTIFKSEAFYCEILNKHVSKGQSVRRLATLLNISPEEVMAIGDHPNDYDMLQYAGIGVAMGNAVEEIKQVATYITATNNEDGVAKAIVKFALS